MIKRGKFIVFEGPDGCGKSTIAKMIRNELLDIEIDCVLTREPGGTKTGEKIRDILLNKDNIISASTEALLMASARAQHIEELIKPSLNLGKQVLCDRFVVSSLVYQGIGRNLGINRVEKLNEFAVDICPDLTIFFDLDYEIALGRRNIRKTSDRMEDMDDDFHYKIHEGYKRIYSEYKEKYNIIRIDSSDKIEKVFCTAFDKVKEILEV